MTWFYGGNAIGAPTSDETVVRISIRLVVQVVVMDPIVGVYVPICYGLASKNTAGLFATILEKPILKKGNSLRHTVNIRQFEFASADDPNGA
jgi:hypothetical protein